MKAPSVYRAVGIARNEHLELLLREPAGREVAQSLLAFTAPGNHALGTHALRLERCERALDEVRRDPAPLEVVPDQRVPTTTLGERKGAGVGQPVVVDVTRTTERLEHLVPVPGGNPSFPETSSELGSRTVAQAKRPERELDCRSRLRHERLCSAHGLLELIQLPVERFRHRRKHAGQKPCGHDL